MHGLDQAVRQVEVALAEGARRVEDLRAADPLAGRVGAADVVPVLAQDHVAALESETDGYEMLSARAEYAFALRYGSLSLFLAGHNLLDQEARRHTSLIKDTAPLPGISVHSGFEWRI